MPEASPRKDSGKENDTIQTNLPDMTSALNTIVKEIWSLTSADGAAIAVRDQQGLRCLASIGNAPPVDSRPQTESRFTRECFESGRVIRCEDAETDLRVDPSVARALHLRSALAVPIARQGSVVGIIEVFSGLPFAFDTANVDELERIARSLAPLLAPWPGQNGNNPSPGSVLEMTPSEVVPSPAELPEGSQATASNAAECQVAGETTVVPGSSISRTARFLRFARKLTIRGCLLLAAALGALVFLFLFVRSRPGAVETSHDASSLWASPRVISPPASPAPAEDRIREGLGPESRTIPGASTSPSPPSEVGKPTRSSSSDKQARSGDDTLVVLASPDTTAERIANRTAGMLSPVLRAPVVGRAALTPPELPIAPSGAAVAPVMPALIKPPVISTPDFVLDRSLKNHSSWVTGVAFSSDGQELASGSWDQTVKLWNVSTGQERTVGSKMKEIQTVAFSRDGHWLAAEDSTNTVTLWDAVTDKLVRNLTSDRPSEPLGANWVYSMTFSPDGRWLAAAVDDKTVRVWDVNTGRPVRDLSAQHRSVMYAAFSPDGRWLASGADDKSIGIWDVTSGEMVRKLSGHKKAVHAVAFSPAGRLLASASADKNIKLWDFATGREVRTLTGHGDSVSSLAFSPDGRWLASGSWDKTIKVWDVDTARELQTLEGNGRPVYSVAFDARGRWLASGSEDGTVELWRFGVPADRFIAKEAGR